MTAEEQLYAETRRVIEEQGEEPVYILRDLMDDDDVDFNATRMRRGAMGLLRHVDALLAWHGGRRAAS